MASIATVVTRGFGSFGGVNLLPTMGYGSSTVVVVAGPYIVADLALFTPGIAAFSSTRATSNVFSPGITDENIFTPGAIDAEVY